MEELEELRLRLAQERPAPWGALPDIGLYMDQIISYMPRQLISYDDTEMLTSAMVNNYIKDGVLPRADGKKYTRTHLAYLTAICALKQVLSVRETKALLSSAAKDIEPEALYEKFLGQLDQAMEQTAQTLEAETPAEELPRLALGLALRSYADKLACERVLNLLVPEGSNAKPERKKRSKEE